MRIAQVTDFYLPRLGGIEMHVCDLAGRQAAAGHEVEVLTGTRGARSGTCGGPAVVGLEGATPLVVSQAVRRGTYDAVHVHVGVGSPLGFWAARAAALAGLPTVVTVHSLWVGVHGLFRALDAAGGWSELPLRWTAVSEEAARPVRRVLGPRREVGVLPNGIDPQQWVVERRRQPDDDVLMVAVMRLARRKRALPLLRMLREVRARVPGHVRLQLALVGDGPQRPAVARYLARHGMTGWVQLQGRRSRTEIRELYRSADVFVAPADLESFGIAALEARCAGVPVVARAGTGIGSFVEDGREGLLVPSDGAMTDALVRLCLTPHLRRSLGGDADTCSVGWDRTLPLTDRAYAQAAELAAAYGAATRRAAEVAG